MSEDARHDTVRRARVLASTTARRVAGWEDVRRVRVGVRERERGSEKEGEGDREREGGPQREREGKARRQAAGASSRRTERLEPPR